MGKQRILLKPKGAATGTAMKKKKPEQTTSPLMLYVVAPLVVSIVAYYALSGDADSGAGGRGGKKARSYSEPPSYQEKHGDIHAMVQWIESHGGAVDPRMTIEEDDSGQRGVYFYGAAMTRTERERVKFVEIPETIMLSSKSMLDPKSHFGRTVDGDDELVDALLEESDKFRLAVTIMAESHYEDSFWRPFLNTLPKSDSGTPLLWSEEQLKSAQANVVATNVEKNNDFMKERLPKIEALAEKYPDLFPDNYNLLKDLTWFSYLTSKHTFAYAENDAEDVSEDGADKNKVFNAFTPFVDLPNHSFGKAPIAHLTNYKKDETEKEKAENENEDQETTETFYAALVTISPKKLVHGGELILSFQQYAASTMYYLQKHGTVDVDFENNTRGDYVNLKLPGSDWPVHDDGTFDFETAQFATKHAAEYEMTTEELRAKVQETVDALPTTLEQDRALLFDYDVSTESEVPVNALLIRIRFKQVLRNLIRFLEAGATAPVSAFEINYRGSDEALFELDLSLWFYRPPISSISDVMETSAELDDADEHAAAATATEEVEE